MTTTTIPTKKTIFLAMEIYQDCFADGADYMAPETVIAYLLSKGVDMAEAHSILCAITVADQYDLKLS